MKHGLLIDVTSPNMGSLLTSLSQILQSSFNATYRGQTTTESSNLEAMHIFCGEKIDLPPFFQNLET